jgi:hypothetical protein
MVSTIFHPAKRTWRNFRKIEEVLNGYVTNPNPTPTLTPNPNLNPNSNPNPNRIIKKIQKETTIQNR